MRDMPGEDKPNLRVRAQNATFDTLAPEPVSPAPRPRAVLPSESANCAQGSIVIAMKNGLVAPWVAENSSLSITVPASGNVHVT